MRDEHRESTQEMVRPIRTTARSGTVTIRSDESPAELRRRYDDAKPFRHILFDNFLDASDASAIADAFPKPQGVDRVLASLFAARTYNSDLTGVDEQIGRVFTMLGAPDFIAWLEAITGIPKLQIDEDFIGAGLHQAVNGSSLPVHADHNTHPKNNALYRRLNLLIYMNPRWEPQWGGILELWDRDAAAPAVSVVPLLNRCIVMEVNDRAFHGYRQVRVPDGIARNAIVVYYYSPQPAPLQEIDPHPTIFPVAGQSAGTLLVRRIRHGLLLRILAAKDRLKRRIGDPRKVDKSADR